SLICHCGLAGGAGYLDFIAEKRRFRLIQWYLGKRRVSRIGKNEIAISWPHVHKLLLHRVQIPVSTLLENGHIKIIVNIFIKRLVALPPHQRITLSERSDAVNGSKSGDRLGF